MNETFITLQGNLATDLRRGTTNSDALYASFRLACTVRRQIDGEWRDAGTSFYQVTAYRALAEHALASLGLGQPVVVYGRQQVQQWESGDKKGTDVKIEAITIGHDLSKGSSMFFRGGRRSGGAVAELARQPVAPPPAADAVAESIDESVDEPVSEPVSEAVSEAVA